MGNVSIIHHFPWLIVEIKRISFLMKSAQAICLGGVLFLCLFSKSTDYIFLVLDLHLIDLKDSTLFGIFVH